MSRNKVVAEERVPDHENGMRSGDSISGSRYGESRSLPKDPIGKCAQAKIIPDDPT